MANSDDSFWAHIGPERNLAWSAVRIEIKSYYNILSITNFSSSGRVWPDMLICNIRIYIFQIHSRCPDVDASIELTIWHVLLRSCKMCYGICRMDEWTGLNRCSGSRPFELHDNNAFYRMLSDVIYDHLIRFSIIFWIKIESFSSIIYSFDAQFIDNANKMHENSYSIGWKYKFLANVA